MQKEITLRPSGKSITKEQMLQGSKNRLQDVIFYLYPDNFTINYLAHIYVYIYIFLVKQGTEIIIFNLFEAVLIKCRYRLLQVVLYKKSLTDLSTIFLS